jgi:hypothetical protein
MIDEAYDTINKAFQELGTKPQVAIRVINFLNSNANEVLEAKGVRDITIMVMEVDFHQNKFTSTS